MLIRAHHNVVYLVSSSTLWYILRSTEGHLSSYRDSPQEGKTRPGTTAANATRSRDGQQWGAVDSLGIGTDSGLEIGREWARL